MKFLKFSLFALFAVALSLTSCNSDDIDDGGTTVIDPPTETVETNPLLQRSNTSNDGLELGCVVVLYDFDLVDDSGNTYTITSEDDFFALLNNNTAIADFVFPLSVSINGVAETLDDGDALGTAFAACVPSGGFGSNSFPAYNISEDNSCYELIFPIAVLEQDSTVTTIDTEQDFDDAVADRLIFFVFPMDLVHEDGSVITVSSPNDLFGALASCGGYTDTTYIDLDGLDYIACYELQFPAQILLVDGSVITVNNHQELCDLMLYGQMADYSYPLTLSLNDSTITVNNETELSDAISACPGFDPQSAFLLIIGTQPVFTDTMACWTIEYPIDLIDLTGSTITVNDQAEFEAAVFGAVVYEVVFPVSYTFISSGMTSTANSLDELTTDLENCQ